MSAFEIIDRIFSSDFVRPISSFATNSPKAFVVLLAVWGLTVVYFTRDHYIKLLAQADKQKVSVEDQKRAVEEQKRAVEAHNEFLRTQLAQAREKSGREYQDVATHRTKVTVLVQAVQSNAELTAIKSIVEEVQSSANEVLTSSATVNQFLMAANLTAGSPQLVVTPKFSVTSKSE
jgi:hypothetical protein